MFPPYVHVKSDGLAPQGGMSELRVFSFPPPLLTCRPEVKFILTIDKKGF